MPASYWHGFDPAARHHLAPSLFHLAYSVDPSPLRIVARSEGGRQMLCVAGDMRRDPSWRLHLFVRSQGQGSWVPVGAHIQMSGEVVAACFVAVSKGGGEARLHFADARLALISVERHFHGDPPRWSMPGDEEHEAICAACDEACAERKRAVIALLGPDFRVHAAGSFVRISDERFTDFVEVFCDAKPVVDDESVPLNNKGFFTGRPRFSRDKGTRPPRSSPLPHNEEEVCLFAAAAIAIALHGNSLTLWRADAEMQRIFGLSIGARFLTRSRKEHAHAVAQLRRWIAAARDMAQASAFFTKPPKRAEAAADVRSRMQSRSRQVCDRVRKWQLAGCPAGEVMLPTTKENVHMSLSDHIGLLRLHKATTTTAEAAAATDRRPPESDTAVSQAVERHIEALSHFKAMRLASLHHAPGPAAGKKKGGLDAAAKDFDFWKQNVLSQVRDYQNAVSHVIKLRDIAARSEALHLERLQIVERLQQGSDDWDATAFFDGGHNALREAERRALALMAAGTSARTDEEVLQHLQDELRAIFVYEQPLPDEEDAIKKKAPPALFHCP